MAEPEERERLLRYLSGGVLVLMTSTTMDDVVDPRCGAVVPLTFRTDGAWVWSEAVVYYLHHHLIPEADLVAHVDDQGELPSTPRRCTRR